MNRIQKQKDNSYNVLISGNSDSIISELSEYSITKMYIENYESKEEDDKEDEELLEKIEKYEDRLKYFIKK